ncbi:alpha/beta hydrolase family protein [Serinibacter salmoneus]|uniref:Uncharacterized protein n=1 Tax=Serinibacter salmoneus TaxID=556530 RepID=A0A2A9D2D9_9MICO|nr:alpha/beta hydrolase [Serinibacter salmoneus]PFG20019.1 hypothetical protein ATL40_1602 [Serinibacter salmoneus]
MAQYGADQEQSLRLFGRVRGASAGLRVVVWSVLTVVAFALVGAFAGPAWQPNPVTATVEPATADTAVSAASWGGTEAVGRYETVSRQESVQSEGVEIEVLIVEPVGLADPAPAVVFLHGAGTGRAQSFAEHATALASAGIVAVVPDKRLDTYTTFQRDYEAMAVDYAVTYEMARELPGVDPDRVGLYAESEGTWIAPVLAQEHPEVAFQALISAPIVTPREQAAFAVDAYLRNVGVPHSLLRAIPRGAGAHLPGGILAYADFDVLPYLAADPQPIFMAYGTQDASMPTVQAPQIVAGVVPGGTDQVMLRYYEGANHGIRIGSSTDPVVGAFFEDLSRWMLDPAEAMAQGPAVAGATPSQLNLADAVPEPQWYADGEMLLRVPLASAATLAGGVLILLVSSALVRVRGRVSSTRSVALAGEGGDEEIGGDGEEAGASVGVGRSATGGLETTGLARPLSWLVAMTLLVLASLLAYIVAVARLALDYSTDAVLVWGGWVLVQALAVAAAVSLVFSVRALPGAARACSGQHRVWTLLGAGATILGCVGLLIVAGYWGAFSPIS